MFVTILYLLFTEAKGSTLCSQEPSFLPTLQWQVESGPGLCTLLLQKALLILLSGILLSTPRPVGFSFRILRQDICFLILPFSACVPHLNLSSEGYTLWSNLVNDKVFFAFLFLFFFDFVFLDTIIAVHRKLRVTLHSSTFFVCSIKDGFQPPPPHVSKAWRVGCSCGQELLGE
jgi:hypothetical protein